MNLVVFLTSNDSKLQIVASNVALAADRAIAENPNGNAVKDKPRRDLTAAYLIKCDKENELAEKKFKWEQDCYNQCIDKGYRSYFEVY